MATNNLGTERRVVLVVQPKKVVKIDGRSVGLQGRRGPVGEGAYDVAVAEGFIGSRAEWLATLVGPTGSTEISEDVISSAPDNRLTLSPDGLYVPPPQLSTNDW